MATFSPPIASKFVPPILPETTGAARGLFRHYTSRARGANVFKLSDGTYVQDITTDSPVAIAAGAIPYPWNPDNPSGDVKTGQPFVSYTDQNGVEQYISGASPYIVAVYWGGHATPITAAEQTALTAAGYGACIT